MKQSSTHEYKFTIDEFINLLSIQGNDLWSVEIVKRQDNYQTTCKEVKVITHDNSN